MSLVYLGGPVSGQTYENAQTWRIFFSTLLAGHIKALSPLRGEVQLASEDKMCDFYEDMLMSSRRAVYVKDKNDVWRCDALVVNLLNTEKVTIGSVGEIFWADAWGKPIVVVMEDAGNIHDHGMIRECAGWVVNRLEDAADVVNTILTPGV